MTDLRKAATQAREELQNARDHIWLSPEKAQPLTEKEMIDKLRTAISALSQALAQPVDAVNMTPDRVDETAKGEQEPVFWMDESGALLPHSCKSGEFSYLLRNYNIPLYAAPPTREWVGLSVNEARKFYEKYTNREELIYAIDEFLEEKNARQQE